MNVLIIEPEKVPREAEIGSGLKAMQDVVGGYIEAVYPYDDPVTLICNEDGKLSVCPLTASSRITTSSPGPSSSAA